MGTVSSSVRPRKWAVGARALAGIFGLGRQASAAVVFSDTFGAGSTINQAVYPTVTASSTAYQIASTKNQSPATSIASGHLKMGLAATTSGVDEAQALFSSAPLALAVAGDSIEYTLVFTNTTGLLGGGNASALYLGLYNSAGTAPVSGLSGSGLNATAGSSFATGGTAGWQGYTTRVVGATGNNQIYTRPIQNGAGTSSANQDLVGNGAGGGLYNNPTGATVGSNVASTVPALTAGNVYTSDLTVTLNGDGSETWVSSLYDGASTGAPILATQTSTTSTTPLTTSFDGLVFGWRQSGTSVATGMDVNSVTINSNVSVPEPAMAAIFGLSTLGLLKRRRRD